MKDFDFDPDLELDCLSDSDEEVKPEPQTYLQLQILEDVMDDNSKSNGASSIRKKNLDTSADSIEVDSESEGEMIIDESPKDSNYIFSTKGNDDETDEEREEFEREDEEKKRNRKNGGMEVDDDDNLVSCFSFRTLSSHLMLELTNFPSFSFFYSLNRGKDTKENTPVIWNQLVVVEVQVLMKKLLKLLVK